MKVKRSYLYMLAAVTVFTILLLTYTYTRTGTTATDAVGALTSDAGAKLSKVKDALPYKKDKTKYYKNTELDSVQAVHQYIDSNSVMVFSKSYCPHSKRAKDILKSIIKGRYTVLELDKALSPATMAEYQNELLSVTGARSVPRVFIDGKSVGGADDVARLFGTGELQRLLQGAKVL